ncbi:MAG: cation diffusion facilitator family transporter [Thermoplasmatota archaeon]
MEENRAKQALLLGIILTASFFIIELIGGYISGSLSLLSDAGHMLRDVLALVLSLSAIRLAARLPTKSRTFGYHRVEIMVALFNGIMLLLISGWIFYEAYNRITDPRSIDSTIMFGVAVIGLLVNAFVAWKLHGSHDLNIRSAFLHVLSDLMASVAVIVAAIIIHFTGYNVADPILSIIIGILILATSIKLVRDSLIILLDFTPNGVDMNELIKDIENIKGVESVHNVHIWSLCSNVNVLDAHIYSDIKDVERIEEIKYLIKEKLASYNIKHATLEFECNECESPERIGRIVH